jgi:putative transposase
MFVFISSFFFAIRVFFQDRGDVALEVLALRQQVAILKRKRPRPVLKRLDRFFWATLART